MLTASFFELLLANFITSRDGFPHILIKASKNRQGDNELAAEHLG
jgi:hypothetical protein